jgi:Tol biopolymer transport system component
MGDGNLLGDTIVVLSGASEEISVQRNTVLRWYFLAELKAYVGRRLGHHGALWATLIPLILLVTVVGRVALQVSAAPRPAALVESQEVRPNIRIAFIRGGDVWVFDTATGAETRLTTTGRTQSLWWTADGKTLFFATGTPGQTGQTFRWQVGSSVQAVQSGLWSPDGATLAFVEPIPGAPSANVIWVEKNGQRARITPVEPGYRWTILAWSADSRRLALGRITLPPSQTPGPGGIPPTAGTLWVTDGDVLAGRLRQLPLPPSFGGHPGWPDTAFWSPDGRYFALGVGPDSPCASCRADGLPLYAVPVDGRSSIPLGTALVGFRGADALTWAPSGSYVVLSAPGGRETYRHKQLQRFDPATGASQDLSRDQQWSDVEPTVSPDGKEIAFARGQSLRDNQGITDMRSLIASRRIWLMDASGAKQHQITNSDGWTDSAPVWTSDGHWIVFVRWRSAKSGAQPQAELWAVHPDSSGAQRLIANLDLPVGFYDGIGFYGSFDWRDLFAVAAR